MSNIPEEQINEWLKKLERESWQLELLVSAFTIFLLIQATNSFDGFITEIEYQYNFQSSKYSTLYLFLGLVHISLQALVFCLISHLMLRGFWIGTIGLRSVQSSIDFSRLNYSEFFTEKLKKKVISLDQLVIKLDEICSVIFAFAFLVISILMAFGMYLIFIGVIAIVFNALLDLTPDSFDYIITKAATLIILTLLITGLLYMIDYFTLGFFKKIKWFSRIYYPFYRLYNFITVSILSRSIYYYMISKFSKRKIRMVYAIASFALAFTFLFKFDQHPYYPVRDNEYTLSANYYDNLRPESDYIDVASIESDYVQKPFLKVFLRYNARYNNIIKSHCGDFTPLKEDGLNWRLKTKFEGGNLHIGQQKYEDEDFEKALTCLSSIYQIEVNDSIYESLTFRFYTHPRKGQKGLQTILSADGFLAGENTLQIKRVEIDSAGNKTHEEFATIPFWYQEDN
ncbi:MAG: hypothetical protein ABJF11_15975 [Reichenbachiella sp.]|uniref:hypothetical protein n=1 Tax=Reichenbachiella sp. TaxID=2184521 RepID=UPI0032641CF1